MQQPCTHPRAYLKEHVAELCTPKPIFTRLKLANLCVCVKLALGIHSHTSAATITPPATIFSPATTQHGRLCVGFSGHAHTKCTEPPCCTWIHVPFPQAAPICPCRVNLHQLIAALISICTCHLAPRTHASVYFWPWALRSGVVRARIARLI